MAGNGNHDAEMAKRMKLAPHRYPDSIIHGGHKGNGWEYRKAHAPARKSDELASYHDAKAFGMMIERAGGYAGIMAQTTL